MLLHESGLQPVYYFPPEDVRADVLEPSDKHTHCPKKGDASYYTIRVGDRVVENGAWYYPDPLPDAPPLLKGLIAFYFDRMDRWLEEDEEIGVHPRDPYHRIDILRTDRHVRVSLDGELLAESRAGDGAVRVEPPAALVHPARGRRRRARAQRHGHPLPVQGHGELLLGQRAEWTSSGTTPIRCPRPAGSRACSASSTRRSTSSSTASSEERPETPWSSSSPRRSDQPPHRLSLGDPTA